MPVTRASSILFLAATLAVAGTGDRMVIYRPVEASSLFGLGGGSGVLEIYTKGN